MILVTEILGDMRFEWFFGAKNKNINYLLHLSIFIEQEFMNYIIQCYKGHKICYHVLLGDKTKFLQTRVYVLL